MPVPTSYTLDTFEDYLKYEVLQETAFSLGWATDIPITPVTWKVVLISADDGSSVFKVAPLKYPIAKGMVLEFKHRVTGVTLATVTMVSDAYEDEEIIETDTEIGLVNPSVLYRAEVTTHEIPPAEPVFEPIIKETLDFLKVADITTQTGEDLIKLRTRGRLETWRKVMAFTSFDYPYQTQGATLNRNEVYDNAVTQYNGALVEWNNLVGSDTALGTVVLHPSTQTRVKVVW